MPSLPLPDARELTAVDQLRQAEEEIRSLSSEILERYEEATLVYRLSDRLGSVLGVASISRLVLEEAVQVLRARSGRIWLCDEGSIALVASVPEEPMVSGAGRDAALTALHARRPWTSEEGDGTDPVAAVPLQSPEGPPIGALVLMGRDDPRPYRSGDVKLLTALAALTAAFIRNDRLADQARRAEAREREAEIAQQVYRSLLPQEDPDFHGLQVSGACVAADHIGGDYFGYLPMPDGSLGLVMADVSGHGVGSALYMAAAKGALQAEARRVFDPADLLRRTNESLVADFRSANVFTTAFFARFHPGGRRLEFANGGHNPPLLVRSDGRVERLESSGPALGMASDVDYQLRATDFRGGDLLLVYTDGLVESRDDERCFYGVDRLTRLACEARAASAEAIRRRVEQDLARHRGSGPAQDDVTLVAVKGVDSGAPRTTPRRAR
jgi:serine phosphatase RsbU (regulator of sigma subunit)